jgi:hypothetical protein
MHGYCLIFSFLCVPGYGFKGSGFKVQGSGFRVQGSGFLNPKSEIPNKLIPNPAKPELNIEY